MVLTRSFEGEETASSLTSAAKGLSPFAIPILSETEIEEYNDKVQAIEDATSTTVSDVQANKLSAVVPPTFDKLIHQLKAYANLLFCVFYESSPLYIQILDIITSLGQYSEQARLTMTTKTRASILWIILIQSRHFAAGKMKGDRAMVAAFTQMSNNIKTNSPIEHGDVPPSLYTPKSSPTSNYNGNSNKRHLVNPSNPPTKRTTNSLTKEEVKASQHPLIASALSDLANIKPRPYIGAICRAANISSQDLFKSRPHLCLKAQFWGACRPNCEHEHKLVTDEEAKAMLQKIQPAIDNPSAIKNKVN